MADLAMIVRMVIYKCRELNNPVTETLAAYVAQTTLNGATGRFYLENQISEEEAKQLVDITIDRLQQVDQPSLSKFKPFFLHFCTIRWSNKTEHSR